MLTGLDDIRQGTNQAEYKREYIQFHAVMIKAFGYAVQRLSEGRGVRGVTLMIEDPLPNRSMPPASASSHVPSSGDLRTVSIAPD
ncbi:hypothetical protein Q6253_29625, partial [Klebsiella quasipneumoniae]|nr:hypothetical protein [Klebsiella quasipneumoniae]